MKKRPHVWFKVTKKLPFEFCGRCGLIALKNDVTYKAIKALCSGREEND